MLMTLTHVFLINNFETFRPSLSTRRSGRDILQVVSAMYKAYDGQALCTGASEDKTIHLYINEINTDTNKDSNI